MIRAFLPLRTVSEMNSREHWAKVRKRQTEHRRVTAMYLAHTLDAWNDVQLRGLVGVTLTRIAARPLDDDNLRGALKGVRDGVADALGVDDADPRVTWEYGQERGAPKQFAVKITIEKL